MTHIDASDIADALVGYEIVGVRKKRGGEFKDEQMTLTLRHPKTKEEIKAKIHYFSSNHELWVDTYQNKRAKKVKKAKKAKRIDSIKIRDDITIGGSKKSMRAFTQVFGL